MGEENPVLYLNVFHLTPFVNKIFRRFNVGAYHSQLSIGDRDEVFFGFLNQAGSGIQHSKKVGDPPPELAGAELYKKFDLGKAKYDFNKCKEVVRDFENCPDWLAEHYHIFYHNCNSFTRELCNALLGRKQMKNYPLWISNGERTVGTFIYRTSISYVIELFGNGKVFVFGTPVGSDGYQKELREEKAKAEHNYEEPYISD